MLDRWLYGRIAKMTSEWGDFKPVVMIDRQQESLGGAGNAANAVRELGDDCTLIGLVGNDEAGRRLSYLCAKVGIRSAYLEVVFDRPTTVKTRLIYEDRIRFDHEISDLIKPWCEDRLIEKIENLCPKADAVLISDYAKGACTEKVIQAAIKNSKMSFIDPKGNGYRKYRGATLIKPNISELPHNGLATDEAAMEMVSLTGSILLVTEGAAGATVFRKDEPKHHIPAESIELGYDRGACGAGDIVLAVVASEMAKGKGVIEAVEKAVQIASQRCAEDPKH